MALVDGHFDKGKLLYWVVWADYRQPFTVRLPSTDGHVSLILLWKMPIVTKESPIKSAGYGVNLL